MHVSHKSVCYIYIKILVITHTKMSMNRHGALILSRISIIISSSLAHVSHDYTSGSKIIKILWRGLSQMNQSSNAHRDENMKVRSVPHTAKNASQFNEFQPLNKINDSNASTGSTCALHTDPCTELQTLVSHAMVLVPLGLALIFVLAGALPTLLLKSRYRVYGVKSCMWVLIELWVHLLISFAWFMLNGDRAQAYVWALHSSTYVLTTWQPRKSVINHPGLQKMASLTGAACVALFAWHLGPPVGLAAWSRRSDAQCGWKVHLTAVVGVELVEWALGPLEWIVSG